MFFSWDYLRSRGNPFCEVHSLLFQLSQPTMEIKNKTWAKRRGTSLAHPDIILQKQDFFLFL